MSSISVWVMYICLLYSRHIQSSKIFVPDVCVQVYGRVGGCVWGGGVERMGSYIL